jgi:hypothetical protein
METLGNAILPNSAPKYYCNFCDYGTSKKSSFDDHNLSAKHKMETKSKQMETPGNAILLKMFFCENCEKKFKNRSGLWKHDKICKNKNTNETTVYEIDNKNEGPTDKELMMMVVQQNAMLIKENSEFKNMMIEVIKNGTHNTTHTNSHNKTFNLQFFLNETCKDAMNIMDFVDSLKLQLSDLENLGKIGYVDGISKIIVHNLNLLDETKRPVHCTDSKREVMYVKDEDKWEKENDDKSKMRKVIKHVAHKNTKLLKDFKAKYPDCEKSDSRYSDKYDKLVIEAFGGTDEKEYKIIKKIAKEVIIDK